MNRIGHNDNTKEKIDKIKSILLVIIEYLNFDEKLIFYSGIIFEYGRILLESGYRRFQK